MDTDLMLVIGIVIGILTIPVLLSAYSEGRVPRVAAIMVLISGVLLATALSQRPSGYSFDEAVSAFGRVFARFAG